MPPLHLASNAFIILLQRGNLGSKELLTAPYDFPILKSSEELKQEQEEVKTSVLPLCFRP